MPIFATTMILILSNVLRLQVGVSSAVVDFCFLPPVSKKKMLKMFLKKIIRAFHVLAEKPCF
jgi:hypothetical protein